MGALEVVHPLDCVACDEAALPRAAWADAKRAEMAKLVAELRSIQAKRDGSSRDDQFVDAEGITPSSIVPMLETMLAAAMERIDAQAAEARTRTDAVVAEAVVQADELQRSVVEVQAVLRWDPDGPPQPRPVPRPRHLKIEPDQSEPQAWDDLEPPDEIDAWDELDADPLDPRLDALGKVVDLRDADVVHDAFWRDVLADPPVRERLRRWVQGQPS